MANNEMLGASFSIDVTDLKAGLNQANRLIRESESEFKAAAAGMDNWSESQEGLEARIKHLNTATDLQRKKVDALQAEYDRLIAEGLDPASKEAVELRTKINKETEALNKNETEIKKQTKALEELGEETEKTADATDDASEGFTVMAGAAATLVAEGVTRLVDGCKQAISTLLSLGEETREYRENLIKLKTSFQTANLTTEDAKKTFEELYGILGDEGAATEAAQQLAKISKGEEDLEANTRILTGVMAEYGASIPLEGLAEGIAATSAMSSVQGVLADALEWQGINLDEYNEKLATLKTEEERAAYIQKTLIDLYGKSADIYRENNKSVIAARKATATYTDQMAELGEVIEPVNADIAELKTEFAREFVPVIKNDVAPAIKSFIKQLKETNAAEKVGKVVSYVAENFVKLAKITFTAVTAFSAFNAALKITTAIGAAKTALAGLTAGVNMATKAQVGLNAAMSSNPIGAILTAVALLTTGIVLLAKSTSNAAEKIDLLNKRQRDAVTAANDAADAYRETKAAADEMATAGQAQIDYAEDLWAELKNLASASGEVKESDKARAQFILTELNSALDTEYKMTGNIITNYKDMVKSLEKVIETKRAQILLEAYEESYAQSVKNVAAAEKARATQAQELYLVEEEIAKKKNEIAAQQELVEKTYDARTRKMYDQKLDRMNAELKTLEDSLAIRTEEYQASDAALKGYYDNINSYETASTLVLQGETSKAIGYLNKYGGGFQTAASVAQKSKDEQLAILKDQVVNTEVHLGLLEAEYANKQANMTAEEKRQAELRIENAKKQAEDAKNEYATVGGNMIDGMVKGAEDSEWTLTDAMKSLVDSALKAAKKAAGIKSPARKFKKPVGGMIGLGVASGIDASTNDVVSSVKNQVKAIEAAYDTGSINANVNAGVKTTTANNSENAPTGAGVTVYQTNNFKQAYTSRKEQYKAKQELYAAARLMKAGAF